MVTNGSLITTLVLQAGTSGKQAAPSITVIARRPGVESSATHAPRNLSGAGDAGSQVLHNAQDLAQDQGASPASSEPVVLPGSRLPNAG